jgi:hypothetical protein
LIGISFRGKKWLAISYQSHRDSCFLEACQFRHSNMRLPKVPVAIPKLMNELASPPVIANFPEAGQNGKSNELDRRDHHPGTAH